MCALFVAKTRRHARLTRLLRLVAKRNECIGAVSGYWTLRDGQPLRRLLRQSVCDERRTVRDFEGGLPVSSTPYRYSTPRCSKRTVAVTNA